MQLGSMNLAGAKSNICRKRLIRVRRSVTTMGHILLTLPILLFLLYQRALRAVVDVVVFWSF
ncbi:hypothetical protein C0058_19770 [Pseudomonas sp. NC02]|nr:hypothetical protein C0058_19770 [Pseudomonas sp. NC02]